MPRTMSRPLPMPPIADLSDDRLPVYGTAVLCAQIETHRHAPTSPRAIYETWDLEWRIVNGRAVTHIPTFLAAAQNRFDASRVVATNCRKSKSAPASKAIQQAA
jgi:hypothetical protein